MITRGQATTIFLCIGPFSAWWRTNDNRVNLVQACSCPVWEGSLLQYESRWVKIVSIYVSLVCKNVDKCHACENFSVKKFNWIWIQILFRVQFFPNLNTLIIWIIPNYQTNTNNTKVKIHIIKQPRPTLRMVKIASSRSTVHFNATENYEGCFSFISFLEIPPNTNTNATFLRKKGGN